jgi:FkbM family methyltransferase
MRYLNLMKNILNWWLFLFVKFGLTNQNPLVFKAKNGVVVEVPRHMLHTFKEIFMEECYMHGLKYPLPDNPIIIDIGANVGYFSLFVASRFPAATILSFEPIPSNYKLLEHNLLQNKKFHILSSRKAVSGEPGEVAMTYDDRDIVSTTATITKDGFEQNQGTTIQVQCTTLSDIMDNGKLDRCDFLKMDCEGAEYDIIYKCPQESLVRIKQMAIEVHGGLCPENTTEYLKNYLETRGFSTYETRRALGMLWAWRAD